MALQSFPVHVDRGCIDTAFAQLMALAALRPVRVAAFLAANPADGLVVCDPMGFDAQGCLQLMAEPSCVFLDFLRQVRCGFGEGEV